MRLFMTALAGLAVAALSFGVGHGSATRAAPPSLASLQDVAWLKTQLELSASQVETLHALEEEYGTELIALCGDHCAARSQLAAQLLGADWSADTELALLETMGRTQVRTDVMTLEHIRRVHQVLTPAQQATYERHVSACLATACPHRLHHGSMGHATHDHN